MSRATAILLVLAGVVTAASAAMWLGTGAHPYTKFVDIVERPIEPDPDDPFAGTGFYDADEGGVVTETVKKDVFYFGLFPVPERLFDLHMISVISFSAPAWAILLFTVVLRRIRRARSISPNKVDLA